MAYREEVPMRPKLFLVSHVTPRGNRAMEWSGTTAGKLPVPVERRRGQFWAWLVGLAREAARGPMFRPGGRAGW